MVEKTKVSVESINVQPSTELTVAKGHYLDRFGSTLEKTFQGESHINGKSMEYASWPLVDNPWIHQDWE